MSGSLSYLIVYNAHSGEFTKIPKPVRFLSLQKLKLHIQESFTYNIIGSVDDIFLLTPFGIKLDYSMINEMTELYFYDRRLFRDSGDKALIMRYLQKTDSTGLDHLEPQKFRGFKEPGVFKYVSNSSQSIKNLSMTLQSHEEWANSLAINLRQISDKIDPLIRQINVIFKALNIIFSFASNFVESAEKTFKSQFNYVRLLAMKSLSSSWKGHFDTLRSFPSIQLRNRTNVYLGNFLDEKDLKESAIFVSKHLPGVVSQFNDLTSTINQVNGDKIKVDKFIEAHRNESMQTFEDFEAKRLSLTKEFESLLSDLSSDMETLGSAPSDDLQKYYNKHSAASGQLYANVSTMYQFLRSFHNFREKLALECPEVFENIAVQQLKCVEVKAVCKRLLAENSEIPKNAESDDSNSQIFARIKQSEDLLSTIIDLPLLFGFVLIEKRRQYEWHDFYSKGIVSNMSEQLTIIIEHEQIFQKLWIKKFGRLIKLISPETGLDVHVPAVDVTLVNSGVSLAENSVLNWLKNAPIEREDISRYIELIKSHNFVNSDRFFGLLDRNYKDLVTSTEKLKKITKTVASLRSSSMSDSGSNSDPQVAPKENGNCVEGDADLNIIKGLKSRISKLEDLLHQQQFKNLTGWPVVKNEFSKPQDTKVSMLLKTPPNPAKSPINLLPKATLSRRSSSDLDGSFSSRKVLDASTTIDKHLDNIRLRKEIGELQVANAKLVNENESLLENIEDYKRIREEELLESDTTISELDKKIQEVERELKEKINLNEAELSELKKGHRSEIQDLKTREADTKQELLKYVGKIEELESENASLRESRKSELSQNTRDADLLRDEVASLMAKLSDLQVMNAELLSNMQAKESDFSAERSGAEKQIKDLSYQLEEKTEDFEDLMEVTQSKSRNTEELLGAANTALQGMLHGVSQLLGSNVKYFREFCLILESMGLLLVRELNTETNIFEFRIRRVKGLRSKKDVDDGRPTLERTKSTAVQEVTQSFSWIHELEKQSNLATQNQNIDDTVASNEEGDVLEAETRLLVQKCEDYVVGNGVVSSKLTEFLKLMAFEENVQLQARDDGHDISADQFFSNGIIKRFNDVEGFAKKLTKENKAKAAELSKCLRHSNGKVSVSNFQPGDLVLFLPTRIERANGESRPDPESTVTPWTAFNIDAPHFFLDLSSRSSSVSGEEWVVNRISKMSEFVVTDANSQDPEKNPFALSVGVTWHLVEAE